MKINISRCVVTIFVIGIIIILGIVILENQNDDYVSKEKPLPVEFFDEKAFYDGLHEGVREGVIDDELLASRKTFAGGIVPHHLVAGGMLGEFFERVKNQKPKRIIIIGPNHYELGYAPVISSDRNWQTVFGDVIVDHEVVQELFEGSYISFNDEVMIGEHSTQGMMPYVGYFAPEAKVVPLVLSGLISRSDLEKLATKLETYIDKDTIVVAAVDFSHHLTGNEAWERDKKTIEIINNKDIDELLRLNSEYLDSPASIALIMMLMENTGHPEFTLEVHTNSGVILGDETQEVTSYISGVFR